MWEVENILGEMQRSVPRPLPRGGAHLPSPPLRIRPWLKHILRTRVRNVQVLVIFSGSFHLVIPSILEKVYPLYLKVSVIVSRVFQMTFPHSSKMEWHKTKHKSSLDKWALRWTKLYTNREIKLKLMNWRKCILPWVLYILNSITTIILIDANLGSVCF